MLLTKQKKMTNKMIKLMNHHILPQIIMDKRRNLKVRKKQTKRTYQQQL